jgi:hypothetical protein
MATTSFEAVIDRECGFAGSVMVVGSFSGCFRSWKWSVESHDAEMSSAKIFVSSCHCSARRKLTMLFAIDY